MPASPRYQLADGIRRLIDLTVGRQLPGEELTRAAAAVATLADRLEATALPGKAPRGQPDHLGDPQDIFPTSPVFGLANPVAPPVCVWAVVGENGERELRGRGRFGYAYEGPPTCVHGGVLAETFDELLGAANVMTGRGGMTGTLTVKYRRPTPLLADLDLEARQTGHEGRKLYCWAGISYRGELTAEADAVFIAVSPQHVLDIANANAQEVGESVVDVDLTRFFERGGQVIGGVDGPPPR
ncbi:MAG: PaaI family thioesterase [Acidimicrobiales bacterium]